MGLQIANRKSQIDKGPRLPLIPFAAWAGALVVYHVVFVVGMAAYRQPAGAAGAVTPGYLSLTIQALPGIIAQGVVRLPVALLTAAIWGIAVGAGMAVLRRAGYEELTTGERAVFGGGLGMGILSLGTLVAGTVSGRPRWLLAALLVALLLAMAAAGLRELFRAAGEGARALRAWRQEATLLHLLIVLLGLGVVLLALTRAHVPVFSDYDSLEYHLGAPARWWREGRVTFLRDMVYSNFPLNVEMLHLLAMSCFGGPIMGAVVGLQIGIGFVVLTAGAIAACGRRLGSASAGRAGAAIFLATPMLGGLVTHDSYVVELPMTAYAFLTLFAFLRLRAAPGDARRSRRRLAVLCGAMAGLAIGCKYPAILFVLVPVVAFVLVAGLLRRWAAGRAVREAATVGLVAFAAASPWFVRNAVNTGNPVYPLLYGVFGGANWSPEQDAKFAKAHRPQAGSLADAGRRLWVFGAWRDQPQGDWRPPWRVPAAPLLFLFAIVPLALSGRYTARPVLYVALLFAVSAGLERFRTGGPAAFAGLADVGTILGLVAFVASPLLLRRRGELFFTHAFFVVWFVVWYAFTHRLDRFLDPATPALAVLAGMGVAAIEGRWPQRIAGWLVAGALAFAIAATLMLHVHSLYFGLTESADAYLSRSSEGATYCHAAIEAINQLDEDAVVLFVGEARTFYCRRRVVAATVFDRQAIDRILDRDEPGEPARRVRDGLRDLGISHVYVNWPEVRRLGDSYAYRFGGRAHNGFSDHVNAERRWLFDDMRRRGYLRPLPIPGREGRPLPAAHGFLLYEIH